MESTVWRHSKDTQMKYIKQWIANLRRKRARKRRMKDLRARDPFIYK